MATIGAPIVEFYDEVAHAFVRVQLVSVNNARCGYRRVPDDEDDSNDADDVFSHSDAERTSEIAWITEAELAPMTLLLRT